MGSLTVRVLAGSCLEGVAALAATVPGRVMREMASIAALRVCPFDNDAMDGRGSDSPACGADMPCFRLVSAAEREAGRYVVTRAFLRLQQTLLERRYMHPQLNVRCTRKLAHGQPVNWMYFVTV